MSKLLHDILNVVHYPYACIFLNLHGKNTLKEDCRLLVLMGGAFVFIEHGKNLTGDNYHKGLFTGDNLVCQMPITCISRNDVDL